MTVKDDIVRGSTDERVNSANLLNGFKKIPRKKEQGDKGRVMWVEKRRKDRGERKKMGRRKGGDAGKMIAHKESIHGNTNRTEKKERKKKGGERRGESLEREGRREERRGREGEKVSE